MMRTLRRFVRERDAGPIVEFAVVVPVLLLMLFGIVDFARAFFQRNNLVAAVREGARYAAVLEAPCDPASTTAIKERVKSYFSSVGDTPPADAGIAVIPLPANACGTNSIATITVQIQNYPFTPVTPLFRLLGGNQSIQLRASAVYRWERAP
jgi:Flp pilus assembly protein TadG